ncbi:hypothetical protein CLOM_g14103 [Closterium sp. NIES-68]|nr:hypothetical protein CLOM_g14103 [Closterium sp. NIES-68]
MWASRSAKRADGRAEESARGGAGTGKGGRRGRGGRGRGRGRSSSSSATGAGWDGVLSNGGRGRGRGRGGGRRQSVEKDSDSEEDVDGEDDDDDDADDADEDDDSDVADADEDGDSDDAADEDDDSDDADADEDDGSDDADADEDDDSDDADADKDDDSDDADADDADDADDEEEEEEGGDEEAEGGDDAEAIGKGGEDEEGEAAQERQGGKVEERGHKRRKVEVVGASGHGHGKRGFRSGGRHGVAERLPVGRTGAQRSEEGEGGEDEKGHQEEHADWVVQAKEEEDAKPQVRGARIKLGRFSPREEEERVVVGAAGGGMRGSGGVKEVCARLVAAEQGAGSSTHGAATAAAAPVPAGAGVGEGGASVRPLKLRVWDDILQRSTRVVRLKPSNSNARPRALGAVARKCRGPWEAYDLPALPAAAAGDGDACAGVAEEVNGEASGEASGEDARKEGQEEKGEGGACDDGEREGAKERDDEVKHEAKEENGETERSRHAFAARTGEEDGRQGGDAEGHVSAAVEASGGCLDAATKRPQSTRAVAAGRRAWPILLETWHGVLSRREDMESMRDRVPERPRGSGQEKRQDVSRRRNIALCRELIAKPAVAMPPS